ncbi:MAG: thymidine kinase [Micrococcaceae bacterium]
MAELVFFSGTMDSGKSTLALQLDYTRSTRGIRGLLFTKNDRSGNAIISSRIGLSHNAIEVTDATDFFDFVKKEHKRSPVGYIICDEAQFYSIEQVNQLARIVDLIGIDIFVFGITSDFRTKLFEGSARLFEIADRIETLPVPTLCWCGAKATHNARTVNGEMVLEGEQVVVGDVELQADERKEAVGYETLCRKHHMQQRTAANH